MQLIFLYYKGNSVLMSPSLPQRAASKTLSQELDSHAGSCCTCSRRHSVTLSPKMASSQVRNSNTNTFLFFSCNYLLMDWCDCLTLQTNLLLVSGRLVIATFLLLRRTASSLERFLPFLKLFSCWVRISAVLQFSSVAWFCSSLHCPSRHTSLCASIICPSIHPSVHQIPLFVLPSLSIHCTNHPPIH